MSTATAHSADARSLKQRLRGELRWLRLRLIAHVGLMLLGGVGLLAAVAVIAAPAWRLRGPAGAWAVLATVALLGGWLIGLELVAPLRRIASLKGFTRELERHGDFQNLLEAATQFTSPRRTDPLVYGASADLVAEVLRRASHEAQSTALARRIPLPGVAAHVGLALLSMAVWLVLGVSAPGRIAESLTALARPWSLATPAPVGGLHPLTQNLRVPVGADATLKARDFVGGSAAVVLEINRTGDFWQQGPVQMQPPFAGPTPYRDAVARVEHVEDPFRYRFRKGDLVTPAFAVDVRERPVLRSLAARLLPPAYTGQPASDRPELGGVVSVLEGTRVELRGTASVPLQSAQRLVEGAPPVPLAVNGDAFADTLVVRRDLAFRIGLTDREGLTGEAATVYRFSAIADDPPTVKITAPAQDRVLDRDLRVAIAGVAADDAGLTRVELLYKRADASDWTRRRLYRGGQSAEATPEISDLKVDAAPKEVALEFTWGLGEETLQPGDELSYCLEATDNNALKGGQRSRSAVFRLRLPTVAEVFEGQRDQRTEQTEDLQSVLQEGQELQQTFERLDRELKKNPNPDWAKQQEIQDALRRQEALSKKVQDTSQDLQRTLERFQRDNAGSVETLEKMQKIQELIEGLKDQNLQNYLQTLKQAMDQLSPQEIQHAMAEAKLTQEEYNRRLDRTVELLQQLERERTMSDLVEDVSEFVRRQQELKEQTQRHASEPQKPKDKAGKPADQDRTGKDAQQQGKEPTQGKDGQQQGTEPQKGAQPNAPPPLSPQELARAQQQLALETQALEERLRAELERLKQQQGSAQDSQKEQPDQEGSQEKPDQQQQGPEHQGSQSPSAGDEQKPGSPQQNEQQPNSPSAQKMKEALEQALQKLRTQGKPSQPMQDAAKQLQKNQPQDAMDPQDQASARLAFLYQVLASGMQGMQMASAKSATEKLQKTAYDLLNVSFGEEGVIHMLGGGVRGQRMTPVARDQARLLRSATRLSEELQQLARSNFAIPEQLLASMRQLVSALQNTVDQLELTRMSPAADEATASMGMTNQIVMNLLTAAQSSGGQGGGSTSEQMEQLSMDQSRLNGMTQDLRQHMQDGLSEQERHQLAELRGRQEALRQQLDEIRAKVQDQRRVLGDLHEIGRQMEEVTNELDAGRLSDETQRKQDQILSRLLDAQRSVRERDFAKRRESREADQLYSEQTGAVAPQSREDQQAQIRRWLAPERAPHAYQDDVRRYFRRIQGELEGKPDATPSTTPPAPQRATPGVTPGVKPEVKSKGRP